MQLTKVIRRSFETRFTRSFRVILGHSGHSRSFAFPVEHVVQKGAYAFHISIRAYFVKSTPTTHTHIHNRALGVLQVRNLAAERSTAAASAWLPSKRALTNYEGPSKSAEAVWAPPLGLPSTRVEASSRLQPLPSTLVEGIHRSTPRCRWTPGAATARRCSSSS